MNRRVNNTVIFSAQRCAGALGLEEGDVRNVSARVSESTGIDPTTLMLKNPAQTRCILSIICFLFFRGGVASLTKLLWIFVSRKVGAQDEVVEAVQVRRHRVVTLGVEPDLRAHKSQ